MATYSGLMVRDNWADTGVIPSSGDAWASPDIIPYGTASLDPSVATRSYGGPDLGKPVTNNANNNVYIRSKNISGASITGTVNLYYARSSVFLYPTTWIPVTQPAVANAFVTTTTPPSATIPDQGIALVQAPFVLGGIPANDHYCFISVVNNNGAQFPVPPGFPSNAAFGLWVSQNPNVVYRNIALNPGSTASVVSYTTFGSANPVSSTMIFSVVGTNVPTGTTWVASCNDARLPQPFNANGTFSSSGTAGTQLTVPGNITGGNSLMTMALTFTNPSGQPFPSGTNFLISYYQVPVGEDVVEVDDDFRALEVQAAKEHSVAARDGSGFETVTLILLGSVNVFATKDG